MYNFYESIFLFIKITAGYSDNMTTCIFASISTIDTYHIDIVTVPKAFLLKHDIYRYNRNFKLHLQSEIVQQFVSIILLDKDADIVICKRDC